MRGPDTPSLSGRPSCLEVSICASNADEPVYSFPLAIYITMEVIASVEKYENARMMFSTDLASVLPRLRLSPPCHSLPRCSIFCKSASFSTLRLRTLSPPPSSAAHEPGEATTCALSVAYSLGATRRRSGVCSASTSLIFSCFHQFVKLAAHTWRGEFWL